MQNKILAGKKIMVFWNKTPCSLVQMYQCFTGMCYLHH